MNKIKKILNNKYSRLSNETQNVFSKSISSLVVKIFGIIFTLLISVFLGRTIGAEGIGLLSISKQFIGFILIICLLGIRFVIVKELAIYHQKKDFFAIGQTMNSVYFFNGIFSFLLTILLIFAAPWIANSIFKNADLEFPLLISVLVIPFQIFSRLFGSALLGFNKVWQSSLVDNVLSTFLSILLLCIFYSLNNESITVNNVAIIYAISRVITMCTLGYYWRLTFNYKVGKDLDIQRLLKTSIPLFVISLSTFLMFQIDSLILGSFIDARAVGVYAVASSISLLCNFLLQISSQAISPRFAVLYKENKINELQVLLKEVTKILFFLGAIFFILILFFGSTILGFWGEEFKTGYSILLILTISQVYNVCTGPVGTLLVMSGSEKILMKLNIYISIVSVLLGFLSVYFYGLFAFAISIAIIRITSNSLKILLIKKKLNFGIFH